MFLLRYGFGYLTTIYKFATWESSWHRPLILKHNPSFKLNPFFNSRIFRPQEKKNVSSLSVLILFKIVFRLCLWSISDLYQYEIRGRGIGRCTDVRFVNEEECRCVIMAINIQLCDMIRISYTQIQKRICSILVDTFDTLEIVGRIKGAKSVFVCHRMIL